MNDAPNVPRVQHAAMNRDEFLKLQYVTLREEVKETRSRIYKLVGTGLLVIPTAQYFVKEKQVDVLLLGLPVLIMIVALLYLSENHAMMRCGRYIREHYEVPLLDVEGWEEWLESKDASEPRTVDFFVNACFYALFFFYYVLSVLLAVQFAADAYTRLSVNLLVGTYSAVGLIFGFFFFMTVKQTTSTVLDPERPRKFGSHAGT